jgi:ParB-like chromosome segregation protein Spo0J
MSYEASGSQPLAPSACKISPELLAVQDLMPISAEDREALRESIKRDGIREPLRGYFEKDESGKRVFFVLSGLNRLEIARELNLATVPVEAVEIDKKNREAFAEDENLARRQLSIKAKKNLAARRLTKSPNLSDRQIAARYGLDNKTVAVVRAELVAREEIPHAEKRTDSKGREQAANKPKTPKNTPSDRTGNSQASSAKQGNGSGREKPESGSEAITEPLNAELTGFPAVSAALVAIRHALPTLTKADKKAARKKLERLIQDCDL